MIVKYGLRTGRFPLTEWHVSFPKSESLCTSCHNPLEAQYEQKLIRYILSHPDPKNVGILLALLTGLRIGELCALQWKEIDEDRQLIIVNKTLKRIYHIDKHKTSVSITSPKTRTSNREVPMNKLLLSVLIPIKRNSCSSHYLLTNSDKPTEPRVYRQYFHHLMNKLELPHIRFHDLRHTFATRCIASKCDYKVVSAILGHSSITSTLDMYVHVDHHQKLECIDKMIGHLGI